jgi:hypothetical protein
MKPFESEQQFKQVIEQIFQLMNDHPEVGPRLNNAQAPHLFEFPDLGLRFHVTYTEAAESEAGRHLKWTWKDDECSWEPMIRLTMKGEVANRYFQGKENIAMAMATGRIKVRGPMKKIMELAPITRPIHNVYRDWLEDEGLDHLMA